MDPLLSTANTLVSLSSSMDDDCDTPRGMLFLHALFEKYGKVLADLSIFSNGRITKNCTVIHSDSFKGIAFGNTLFGLKEYAQEKIKFVYIGEFMAVEDRYIPRGESLKLIYESDRLMQSVYGTRSYLLDEGIPYYTYEGACRDRFYGKSDRDVESLLEYCLKATKSGQLRRTGRCKETIFHNDGTRDKVIEGRIKCLPDGTEDYSGTVQITHYSANGNNISRIEEGKWGDRGEESGLVGPGKLIKYYDKGKTKRFYLGNFSRNAENVWAFEGREVSPEEHVESGKRKRKPESPDGPC